MNKAQEGKSAEALLLVRLDRFTLSDQLISVSNIEIVGDFTKNEHRRFVAAFPVDYHPHAGY